MNTHRNPRPIAFVALLAACFVFASLTPDEASAKPHGKRGHHGDQRVDVAFTELDARLSHGELRVTYEIRPRDWRRLEKLHIRPRLNLYVPAHPGQFEFSHAVPITRRSATIVFPRSVSPDCGRFVELRLSGARKHTRIASTSYAAQRGSRVRIALSGKRHHGHHGHHGDRDVAAIRACSANTSWSGDLDDCIKKSRELGKNSGAVINACGTASSWSGDFQTCLDLASKLGRGRPATINACNEATSWSGDFKECLRSSSGYHGSAAATVNACSAATSWSGDFKTCMKEARPLGYRAPDIVNACDLATSWSGEFKQCLVASRRS